MNKFIGILKKDYLKPCLLFDKQEIISNMQYLTNCSSKQNIDFLLPIKSFSHPYLISLANNYLQGFDISNYYEYQQLPKNLNNKFIIINSPFYNCYQFKDLNLICCFSNIEQLNQYIAANDNKKFSIRLNSSELLKESQIHPYEKSRFGLAIEQIKNLSNSIKNNCIGLQIHHGFGTNNLKSYLYLANNIYQFAIENGFDLEFINLGGGLHNLTKEEIIVLIESLRKIIPINIKIIFEPGTFISMNAGYAIGKILSIVRTKDKTIITTDLSKECHLRWSIAKLIQNKICNASLRSISIYGPTCYEKDKLGEFTTHDNFEVGQILLFNNINGYSVGWNHQFNGIEPAEMIFF